MTHSILQGKPDSEHEVTPQPDSPVNDALVAIAQEVAELLKQSYPAQADEIDTVECN
ncbi:MAG: hypothetical protein HC899_36740 [Leptolyngbyaceae cyanobacterium SM1_4_3]|nr:hypothetical protein [Leptolyngbyaceae cyanobacterium SM1_4_3]